MNLICAGEETYSAEELHNVEINGRSLEVVDLNQFL